MKIWIKGIAMTLASNSTDTSRTNRVIANGQTLHAMKGTLPREVSVVSKGPFSVIVNGEFPIRADAAGLEVGYLVKKTFDRDIFSIFFQSEGNVGEIHVPANCLTVIGGTDEMNEIKRLQSVDTVTDWFLIVGLVTTVTFFGILFVSNLLSFS